MNEIKEPKEIILELLKEKASTKQEVYRLTLETFKNLKLIVKRTCDNLSKQMHKIDKKVKITYEDKGAYECTMTFGGDLLIFTMHSNIFTFDQNHFIHNLTYIQEDSSRAYFGLIQSYNFLADSFKFNRANDVGYLIGRIFINKERHFFVEGKRQLGFLYNDLENSVLNIDKINEIIESTIIYCLNFDLLSPPYQAVQEITVSDKIQQSGMLSVKTGKRLGFKFQNDSDRLD